MFQQYDKACVLLGTPFKYYEILDTISVQIITRFQVLKNVQFITLIDTLKFKTYSEKNVIPIYIAIFKS